jgi:phenylalanyl-tRNA synthetase beta chain
VDFDLTPAELRDLITMRVATVDAVERAGVDPALEGIVVARVVEAAPHPGADRLWVTKVDDGSGALLDVVCGAPNVQAGKLYPFAPAGTTLPNGVKIERRRIRGAISDGMLCSPRELRLGEDEQGIMELSLDARPGTPFLQVAPAGDARLVIDVMPNRPDLLSHLGIAREISAAIDQALTLPEIGGTSVRTPAPRRVRASACRRRRARPSVHGRCHPRRTRRPKSRLAGATARGGWLAVDQQRR